MSINRKIAVIGLGYVGLPVAVAFGKTHRVIGFDVNQARITELQSGVDKTLEVESDDLEQADILFTADENELDNADFYIVAVPTPIDDARQPDLRAMMGASGSVGRHLSKGDIVVYESTVYPGATEEDCVPVLEAQSGLKCGEDFTVGYSPERINPGDKEHVFTNITKIVSGQDENTLDIVASVYESVVTAGVYRASSIKVAEAAKVIENTQRDLNISLMNELSVLFKRMDIDTIDVLEAAGTKWNFLPFRPGLVGGHCISVDPYYLTHKAEKLGYRPEVIQAGRRVNDQMGAFVVHACIKEMIKLNKSVKSSKVAIMGLTFKEDCPDLRNSRVVDVLNEFRSYGLEPLIYDSWVDPDEAKAEYGINLVSKEELHSLDAVVVCVAHSEFRQFTSNDWQKILNRKSVVMDIKGILNRNDMKPLGVSLWRL